MKLVINRSYLDRNSIGAGGHAAAVWLSSSGIQYSKVRCVIDGRSNVLLEDEEEPSERKEHLRTEKSSNQTW